MRLLSALLFLGVLCVIAHAESDPKDSTVWHNVSEWELEGQGWMPSELAARFDRLPAKAEKIVREPVWKLSRDSSGLSFRFTTDAREIRIRYRVGDQALDMPIMPATGVSGVDLYALTPEGKWGWVDVSRPKATETEHIVRGIDPGKRTYLAYLPLYNSTSSIEIGVPKAAELVPVPARKEKPVVFYGTSITHGASASRPGLTHPAMLGRWLDIPIVNLGFSGNGKMEPELAALVSEVDASLYVIDCLPNMNGQLVTERAELFVRKLREVRPKTPILLVEDRSFTNSWIFKGRRDRHSENRAALILAYDSLVSSGIKDIYYLAGESLLGNDTEGATDGSHPSDLGFHRQAKAFLPAIKEALSLP